MCLIIDRPRHEKVLVGRKGVCVPVTLSESISAYKLIYLNGHALHQYNFKYLPNTLYKKRKLRPTSENVFGAAFHVYSKKPASVSYCMTIKVVIPKGATVFFGRYGDIATNMLQTLDFPTRYKPND